MNNIIISDTGPLIAFAKTEQLFILEELFEQVIIPKSVYNELRLDDNYKESNALNQAITNKWLKVVTPHKKPSKLLLNILDLGESEAITIAKEMKVPLLIDEQKGRKVAQKENLEIIGSIGILLIAKRKGILRNIKNSIKEMQNTGYRFSKNLYNKALSLTNEKYK